MPCARPTPLARQSANRQPRSASSTTPANRGAAQTEIGRLDGLLAHRTQRSAHALYAAFIDIESPVVIRLRRAVRFDDCGLDQYEPLTGPPPVQDRAPGPPRKT